MSTPPPSRPLPTPAVLGRFRLTGPSLRGKPSTLAAQWRGAVGTLFPDEMEFHGHEGSRTVFRYPAVQYRWVEGQPCMYAWGDMAARVMTHPWPTTTVTLQGTPRTFAEVSWLSLSLQASFCPRLLRYAFGSPWIPLNQSNYARYRTLSPAQQRLELDRILVGNLLSMGQGLGWFFEDRVYAAVEPTRERTCIVKDVPHLGLEGSFVTNLELPNHLALGRSVSHGYGWFVRQE